MLGRCRYFAKSTLQYIPLFGYFSYRKYLMGRWALVLVGMVLVKRDWLKDSVALESTLSSMKRRGWPVWLTMFAEGTRLDPKKLESVRHLGLCSFQESKICEKEGIACSQQCSSSSYKGL